MTVPARTVSPSRVVAVTAGLSASGAVFGAAAGVTALGIVLALTEGVHALGDFGILAIPGALGGALGAVCAPVAGWLLLRRIPLGKAFLGLTIGTVIGGVGGWFLLPPIDHSGWSIANLVIRPILGAAFGFLSAALSLRFLHRHRAA